MKSDDIEELFREAAEKYQLDTEKAAAWDDVFEAVHGNEKPAPPTPPGNEHKKRWLNLLWLLLIPLGWFAHNLWNDVEDNKTAKKEQVTVNKNIAETNNKNENQPAGNAEALKETGADRQTTAPAGNSKTAANTNAATAGAESAATVNKGKSNTVAFSAANTGVKTGSSMRVKTGGGNIKTAITGISKGGTSVVSSTPAGTNSVMAQTGKNNDNQPLTQPGTTLPLTVNANENGEKKGNDLTAPGASVTANSTPGSPTENNKNASVKENKNKKPQQHFFYAGFMASPDISFIHGQKTSPAGVNAGLLVGYQINNRFGVETGVLFDSKNYYTKGEYFDKNRIKYFAQNPEVYVNSVDGDCRMIEIPLNIRYVFSAKNKNRWYAVAGVSSYLMGREYYSYDLSAWGTNYKSGLAYNNHVKNWFSIANLGLGYERSLGIKTNLRIEPFMKLPVSGVGTGNLSLTSTGLFIGLTRRIP